MLHNNQNMEQSNKISKLYLTLTQILNEEPQQKKKAHFEKQITDSPDLPQQIANQFIDAIKTDSVDPASFHETLYLNKLLSSYSKFQSLYQNIPLRSINNFGKCIEQIQNPGTLSIIVHLIEKLYLERSLVIYSASEQLFKSLLKKFICIKQEESTELLTEIMVEMLLDNKKLVPFANNPYYFIEFWLHAINQESQFDRKLYWIQAIKKLYSQSKSEEYLFFESDFRTFIDLLLRAISECPDGKSLRTILECYLVLSCCKVMKEPYKLGHLQDELSCLNARELQIEDLVNEINSL